MELKKSTDFTCPECCQPECAPGCAGLAIKDSVLPVRDAHVGLVATTTARGFALIEFKDHYGVPCSLQQSSLASEDAIWLGCDDAQPKIMARDAAAQGVVTSETTGWVPFPIPSAVSLTTRMHLTQAQVVTILPVLQHFVETGDVVAAPSQAAPASPASAPVAEARYLVLQEVHSKISLRRDGAPFDLQLGMNKAINTVERMMLASAVKVEAQQAGVPDDSEQRVWIINDVAGEHVMMCPKAPSAGFLCEVSLAAGSACAVTEYLLRPAAPLPPVVARKVLEDSAPSYRLASALNSLRWMLNKSDECDKPNMRATTLLDKHHSKAGNTVRHDLEYLWQHFAPVRKEMDDVLLSDAARLPGTNGSGVGE